MFTKTDLAKFENVWDDHPKWVNLGAQKNFARYAARIGAEWKKSSDGFNEFYFKRIVARALIFRSCEKMRSEEHTSELQSLMRSSYAVFCLKKKTFNTLH